LTSSFVLFSLILRNPIATLLPYTTLFRSRHTAWIIKHAIRSLIKKGHPEALGLFGFRNDVQITVENLTIDKDQLRLGDTLLFGLDRKSTRLNSSHVKISYAVFCLKKKKDN